MIQADIESPDAARQRFQVGDSLKLRVLEVISANRVRVDLGNFQTVADIRFPVAPGDELKVKVEAVGRQLKLHVPSPAGASFSQQTALVKPNAYILSRLAEPLRKIIVRFLSQVEGDMDSGNRLPDRVVKVLKAITTHLEPLRPLGDVEMLADRVKARVESSGLFFEKKLEQMVSGISKDIEKLPPDISQRAERVVRGDLKAQLIVLKRFLDNPVNLTDRSIMEGAKQLNRAVTGMLSDINEQQSNTRQADPNQLFQVVMYDLPIQDSLRNGMLKMYFPRKRRGHDPNSFRLSLLLSMDRLGDVRSDIVLREKDLALMFFVNREGARAHFESQLEDIRKALLAYFSRVTVTVTLAEQKLTEFELDLLQVDGDRKINLRV